jgi:histidinol-phosphatase (PHP family)
MKYNYHSHTKWCRHGSGEIEDYILEAIKYNLDLFAITEHVPLESKNNTHFSMHLNEIAAFTLELDEMILKYKGKIKIYKGLECEYYPRRFDFFLELQSTYNYAFLILGNHFREDEKTSYFEKSSPELLLEYSNGLVDGMRTGLFSYIAHPDMPIVAYKKFDKYFEKLSHGIFQASEETNTPLEINATGLRYKRGYPVKKFWEISKQYNIDVLINSDSHKPEEVWDASMDAAYEFADELSLNVVDFFKFKPIINPSKKNL